MRIWLIASALCTAACGFHPTGGADPDARDGDPDAATVDAGSDGAPGIDARLVDAPISIDAAACPPEYTVAVGGSRYLLHGDTDATSLALAAADCSNDLVGQTHLATFENADLGAVLTAVGASPAREIYLGAQCTTTGNACDLRANWTWLASSVAVATALWHTDEPLGGSGFTFTDRRGTTWGLVSSPGLIERQYLCECGP